MIENFPEDKPLLNKIRLDSSSLVKYVEFEFMPSWRIEPLEFYEFPFEKSLAYLRSIYHFPGKLFSEIIEYGLTHNKLTEEILNSFVCEYVENKKFKMQFKIYDRDDGFEHYNAWENFMALWNLIAKIPVDSLAAYKLIKKLPTHCESTFGCNSEGEPPLPVLKALNVKLLNELLCRKDAILVNFRKEIFFSCEVSDTLSASASSYNFDFTHDEFYKLIKNENVIKNLENLSFSDDLSIVYYHAILDIMSVNCDLFDRERRYFLKENRHKLKRKSLSAKYSKRDLKEKLFELAVYKMTKLVVPWTGDKNNAYSLDRDLIFTRFYGVIVKQLFPSIPQIFQACNTPMLNVYVLDYKKLQYIQKLHF